MAQDPPIAETPSGGRRPGAPAATGPGSHPSHNAPSSLCASVPMRQLRLPLLVVLVSVVTAVTAACLSPAVGLAEASPRSDRPNVLFIVVDDLRPETGAYGADYMHTPHLDRLAARGVLFERAYANVPVCGPSRASLLTGLRPTPTRFRAWDARIDTDAPNVPTLPGHFRLNGYETIGLGKVVHHASDAAESWSEPSFRPAETPAPSSTWRNYLDADNDTLEAGARRVQLARRAGQTAVADVPAPPPYESAAVPDSAYFDGQTARKAVRRLRQLAERPDDPFFLAVGFRKPHLPFNAPQRYWDPYPLDEIERPEPDALPLGAPFEAWATDAWGETRYYGGVPPAGPLPDSLARRLVQGYRAATSYIDAQVGLVLDALEATGLAENTVVVVWGDHGFSLGEHGMWAKHSTFDVSLRAPLIWAGPGVARGGRAEGLAEFVDVYPTLVELAGLPRPGHLQGTSLAPVLADPSRPGKDAVFARYLDADAVRTDRWLYSAWGAPDSVYAEMLYDHEADPAETVNVAPARPGVVARARALLRGLVP